MHAQHHPTPAAPPGLGLKPHGLGSVGPHGVDGASTAAPSAGSIGMVAGESHPWDTPQGAQPSTGQNEARKRLRVKLYGQLGADFAVSFSRLPGHEVWLSQNQ